jgi:hypothetical protein
VCILTSQLWYQVTQRQVDADVFTFFGGYKAIKFVYVGAFYVHSKKSFG